MFIVQVGLNKSWMTEIDLRILSLEVQKQLQNY